MGLPSVLSATYAGEVYCASLAIVVLSPLSIMDLIVLVTGDCQREVNVWTKHTNEHVSAISER